MKGRLSGSHKVREVEIDKSTRAVATIDYPHHEIHDGNSFCIFATDEDLDADERLILAFKTPDTSEWFHIQVIASSSGAAKIEVIEDADIVDNSGSSVGALNRHRASNGVSAMLDISQAPDTAGGAALNPTMLGSGSIAGFVLERALLGEGKNKASGVARSINELVLAPNTTYAIVLTAQAADNRVNLSIHWYEHTDKNLTGIGD